jgi:hypothetical protein
MAADDDGGTDFEVLLRQLVLARNGPAVRALAEEQGLSDEELARLVRGELEQELERGGEDRLGPRYNIQTGQYTTLAEWVEQLLSGR